MHHNSGIEIYSRDNQHVVDASDPGGSDFLTHGIATGGQIGDELVPFNTALPSLHAYLGDCADLNDTCGKDLEDGHRCLLPVLSFNDVVVTPGCTLPLLVRNSRAHWALEQALSAAAPYTGLVAVVCVEERARGQAWAGRLGCSARIRRLQRHDSAIWPPTLKVLAQGCQRLELLRASTQLAWHVRICADGPTPRLPREVREGRAHWPPWAWRMGDAWKLAADASVLFSRLFPHVKVLRGDPAEVSYWLARNTPLAAAARQKLLCAATPVHRLRSICALLRAKARAHLRCRLCRCQVFSPLRPHSRSYRKCMHGELARSEDVLMVTDDGPGGLFVNPSGYVHDMLAVREVGPDRVSLLGRPSQEHSWFPGYAWTIANCAACGAHLGWRFTAVQQQEPRQFYGLRRQALTAAAEVGGAATTVAGR